MKQLISFFKGIRREAIKSIIITTILVVLLNWLKIYEDFIYYQDGLKEILLCFIGGYIGLLGFSLSGIAIITGLFNKSHVKVINRSNSSNLDIILKSYQYLSNIAGGLLGLLTMTYVILNSPEELLNKKVFIVIISLLVFGVVFSIIYTIELVKMTVRLYKIKNIYDRDEYILSTIRADINEIRIDLLLKIIMDKDGVSLEQIIGELDNAIDNSEYKNKELLKRYIQSKYKP